MDELLAVLFSVPVDALISQGGIALLGVAAVACSQSEMPCRRRWASVLGLLGQPFWFYATFTSAQWGMFFLCFLYSASWGKGFHQHWLKPYFERRRQKRKA